MIVPGLLERIFSCWGHLGTRISFRSCSVHSMGIQIGTTQRFPYGNLALILATIQQILCLFVQPSSSRSPPGSTSPARQLHVTVSPVQVHTLGNAICMTFAGPTKRSPPIPSFHHESSVADKPPPRTSCPLAQLVCIAKLFATTLTKLYPHHDGGSPYRHLLLKSQGHVTDHDDHLKGNHRFTGKAEAENEEGCFDLVGLHCPSTSFLSSFIPLDSDSTISPQLLRCSTDLSTTVTFSYPQSASCTRSSTELRLPIWLYPFEVIRRVYKTFLFQSPL